MRWNGSAQRDVQVTRKRQAGGGTDLPILRLVLKSILSNAFQRIIEADIRALPYHGQWSGIEVDQEDRAIVWSESDMTAAFHCFLLEPSWYPFQAINKLVSGSLAAVFDSSLANELVVFPALRVMPLGWRSACGLLHRPWEQDWTPPERFGATCRYHERWTKADRISSLFTWTVSAKQNSCTSRSWLLRQRFPKPPPLLMQPGPTGDPEGARQRSYKAR